MAGRADRQAGTSARVHRRGDPGLPDAEGALRAAASANDGDGCKSARSCRAGLAGAGLQLTLPPPEHPDRPRPLSSQHRGFAPVDRHRADKRHRFERTGEAYCQTCWTRSRPTSPSVWSQLTVPTTPAPATPPSRSGRRQSFHPARTATVEGIYGRSDGAQRRPAKLPPPWPSHLEVRDRFYHRRSLVEANPFMVCRQTMKGQWMRCFKILGERVMSRDFDRQVAELQIIAFADSLEPVTFTRSVLNCFTALGTPLTQRTG
jgi:hypothetical protein